MLLFAEMDETLRQNDGRKESRSTVTRLGGLYRNDRERGCNFRKDLCPRALLRIFMRRTRKGYLESR